MSKLYKITKNKKDLILKDLKIAKNKINCAYGLMFASKKRCRNGLKLSFLKEEVRFGASITMLFCFFPLDIIFVNSKNKIVDKVALKPFKFTYVPKEKCLYVVEVYKGGFSKLKIGDFIRIE